MTDDLTTQVEQLCNAIDRPFPMMFVDAERAATLDTMPRRAVTCDGESVALFAEGQTRDRMERYFTERLPAGTYLDTGETDASTNSNQDDGGSDRVDGGDTGNA